MVLRQVAQVNVRLSEGGASGVAQNIASELEKMGIASPFVYGYGPHGGRSPAHEVGRHLRTTPLPIMAANLLSHSLTGRETSLMVPKARTALKSIIENSDIIHLHAIHSYFMDPLQLLEMITAAGRPVVWTLHDQWIMTGRCALPAGCERWKQGCPTCPNLLAYPAARLDRTSSNWTKRRAAVEKLQDSVPTAIIACAEWLGAAAEEAGLRNISVIKNSVDREFWDNIPPSTPNTDLVQSKALFVCRDLRDPGKVSWDFLESVASLPNVSLTVMGNDAPGELHGAHRLPATSSRRDLAKVYSSHNQLIFTSKVDAFPLTIAEALTCGMEVLAINSKAAKEFISNDRVKIFESEELLLKHMSSYQSNKSQYVKDEFFNPSRMVNEYVSIYNSLKTSS